MIGSEQVSKRLELNIKTLPGYAQEYIMQSAFADYTKLMYVYDIRQMLTYLEENGCDVKTSLKGKKERACIKAFIKNLKTMESKNGKKYTSRSLRRKIITIKAFLYYCSQKGLLDQNTVSWVKNIKKEEDGEPRVPDLVFDELTLNTCKLRDETIIRLLMSGISVSQCVRLDINDIKDEYIEISGKNPRQVFLDASTKRCLIEYLKKRRAQDFYTEALFLSTRQQRISEASIYHILSAAHKKNMEAACENNR